MEEEKEEEERRKKRRSKLRLVTCINRGKAHLLTEANQIIYFTSLLASANTLSAFLPCCTLKLVVAKFLSIFYLVNLKCLVCIVINMKQLSEGFEGRRAG